MKRLGTQHLRTVLIALMGAAVAFVPSLTFARQTLPSFVTSSPTPISCDGTPFGHYITLGQDAEMVTQAATSGSFNAFDEYTPALTRSFRSTLLQSSLAGAQFQKGVSIDFNGDGKDEVVTANKLANGNLMLAVYHRDGTPSAVLFDTWTLTQQFGSVDLVAGDFAGNNNGTQQLAVLIRTSPGPSSLRVVVLTGAADGSIAQANDTVAGNWIKSGTNNPVSLARGDVLLDHRDQIIVVNESGSGSTRVLNYNLLEYQPTTAQLPIGAGNTSIGSMAFTDAVGSSFVQLNGSNSIDTVNKIKINAGDLVDTNAAELVLHLQASNENGNFIGQRLYHFAVTRVGSTITGITLKADFSQLVQSEGDNGLMTWDSTIANVDAVSPNEIVIARADSSNFAQKVEAYKAYRVEHTPITNPPTYDYKVNTAPTYTGSLDTGGSGQDMAFMGVAVGDMDADGLAEVMTIVRDAQVVRRSRWTLSSQPNSTTLVGTHITENISSNTYTALGIEAADFDGDSVHANVETVAALCQQVREPTLRSVVWWPPYFTKLQGNTGQELATFGSSISGGSSDETSFGTFTSDDVSMSIGAKVGGEVLGIGAEAEVKATAGYNYEATYGKTSSTENTLDTSEHFSQSVGEGLVVMEENTFDCYSYTIARNSTGLADDSSMRLCQVLSDQKSVSGTDAENWDTTIPAAPVDRPPAQWFPLQRDWASLALFRPVTSNAPFIAGHGPDQITDGLFDTGTDTGSNPVNQPYLQVDLGALYDIADIRVFPMIGQAASLKNFRIYASPSPMNGAAVPSGSSVRVYANENSAGFSYDQWNIWTNSPGNTLRARYVRLQLPGASGSLHVAELQVFGDVHVEVQRYPQAVCDPVKGDHIFNARVWDQGSLAFRTIQVRGDMLWNGSPEDQAWCTNDAAVVQSPIWAQIAIGNSAVPGWDLSSTTTNMIGTTTSIESSTRVGAELDVSGGFVAQVTASGSYEHTSGVSQDNQSSTYWGSGLQMGGQASPFNDVSLVATCDYRPQPYAYELTDLSNTGYRHTMYVVDYVVREGGQFWTRSAVPDVCVTRPDPIFIGNFD